MLFKTRQLKFVVAHSEAKTIIRIPQFMEYVKDIKKDLPNLKHVLVIGESVEKTLNFWELMDKSSVKSPRIRISAKKKEENKWIFSLIDNGIGIDPKTLLI